MTSSTTTIAEEEKYPWMHLFPDKDRSVTYSDLPVDTDDLQQKVERSRDDVVNLTESLTEQRELVQQQSAHLETQYNKLLEMKSVSTATFDKLTSQIERLQKENIAARTQIQELQQEKATMCQQHGNGVFDELIYPILVQSIISHKAGFTGASKVEKTQNGVLRWLHQRRNVIAYLKNHNLHPDVTADLEKILFIDEEGLKALLGKLCI